jgi:hypothetical protein
MALVESRRSTERLSDLLRESKSCGLALAPLILSLSLSFSHTHSLLYLSQRWCLSILYSITLYQFGPSHLGVGERKGPALPTEGVGERKPEIT